MTRAHECKKRGWRRGEDGGRTGGGHVICVCSFHYTCPSDCAAPPSIPCLIISTAWPGLCLPSSVLTTGTAAAPQRHLPALMSPYLTPLALGSGFGPPPRPPPSPPPACPLIYCTPSGCQAEGTELQQQKGRWSGAAEWEGVGVVIVPFLCALSVFIYDIPSMTGATD